MQFPGWEQSQEQWPGMSRPDLGKIIQYRVLIYTVLTDTNFPTYCMEAFIKVTKIWHSSDAQVYSKSWCYIAR